MKIYTKTGDNLTTSVISKRVYKDDIIVECLGTVDELSASIMVATNFIDNSEIKNILKNIVKELLEFGGDILNYKHEIMITSEKVEFFEKIIDQYEQNLEPIKDFILPGNSLASSHLHLSRTIARRLERRLVTYGKSEKINQILFPYINRLSDLLFVLARYLEL